MEPETLPADGERVFVSNGTDVAIAEFVVDANGRRLEFVILPAEGTITHWRPLSDMELP
jgi:hypothetical protein